MRVNVKLAPILCKSTDGQGLVEVKGSSPLECLHDLELQFPSVRRWLYDKQGEFRSEVLFFVNGVRTFAEELTKQSNDGDEIFIMLAIAGG